MASQDEWILSFGRFRMVAVAAAVLLFLGGMRLRFGYDVPMPPAPARPAAATTQSLRSLDFSQNLYKAELEADARNFGVAVPAGELDLPFDYDVSEPRQSLVAGGTALDTRDLLLSLKIERVATRFTNGSMTSEHLVLRIENKTDHALAYRVETRPPVDDRLCIDKGDLAHDALAVAPHGVVERTECPTRNGTVTSLAVVRVETLALPAISYYYVSQLFPPHIGLDLRSTRGHRAPKGAICSDIPEQAIRRAMEKGEAAWRDIVDFYARESCAKFMFPQGYRAFTRPNERPLPVPQKGSGASP